MYTKTFQVVQYLADTLESYVTSGQLGAHLGVSSRMILRYIKEAEALGKENGFEIRSYKGRGYQIKITDQARCRTFFKDMGSHAGSQGDELIREMVRRILISDGCKMEELEELFHYSRSSMSRITTLSNSYLENFGLELFSKAYTGLYISGNEISIRDCMYHLLEKAGDETIWDSLDIREVPEKDIRKWIGRCLKKYGISAKEKEEQQFFKYLAITIKRISLGKEIYFGYLAHLDGKEPFKEQMKTTRFLLKKYFPKNRLEGECMYLTLIWMQTLGGNCRFNQIDEHNLMFFHGLVMKGMKKIRNNYGVDLSGDEALVNGLILHVASSYGKYLVHMETENPFYEELQKIYPTAYYYAIELAECITEYTKQNLSVGELGFLTMYFASSLEQENKIRKFKTAFISETMPGAARLLKSRLEQIYAGLEVLDIGEAGEGNALPEEADFYITMLPTGRENGLGKEVVTVSPFLNEKDQMRINAALTRLKRSGSLESLCRRDSFFLWDKPVRKKGVLTRICDLMIEQGRLKEEEKNAVMKRESLVSTEISPFAALPHCLIDGESFFVFVLMKNPVPWGKANVKLVILGCFKRGDEKIKEVLERLFLMVSDEEWINKLAGSKCYEEFVTYLKEFDGGYLC